jgi:xanthine/CO dehydrogenase XdhC/CoxF family maturation factor
MATCKISPVELSVADPMAASSLHRVDPSSGSDHPPNATEALHRVRDLVVSDPDFEAAFRASDTTQAAAALAHGHGIDVSAEALWRHRGMLARGGLPTWRG